MQTKEGKVLYAKRKSMVKTVFSSSKQIQEFGQFLRLIPRALAAGWLIKLRQP